MYESACCRRTCVVHAAGMGRGAGQAEWGKWGTEGGREGGREGGTGGESSITSSITVAYDSVKHSSSQAVPRTALHRCYTVIR